MKCKLVIALLWGFFLSLGTTFAQQVTNKIYIPVIECGRGKTVHIPFYLTNNTEIVALQFNLQLPSGCTLVSSSWNLTDRKTDHTVAIQKTGNNRYVVIVYSPTNAALRGNSGELLNFSLGIPETWEIGSEHSFAIEEPILSARNGDNVLTTFDSGALKVTADPRPDVAVSTVKVNQLTYAPGDKIAVSWLVKNEGDKETGDGWSEQILLVADNGESLYLGTVYYNSIVGAGGTTTRQAEFSLSDLLGIEGKAKVKVKLIPGVNLGELTTAYGNNVAHSENELTVTKKIKINLPTTALKENYNSLVRCQLYRSGSWMSEQMFTLRADKADRLKVPETVTIPSGQSGTAFYIQVIDNDILNTDSIVKILVEGNGYEALEGEIGIEDDELPELLLKTSKSELTEGEAFVLTITRKPVSEKPLTVYLACDHDRRFKYPQTAQIAAGDASVDLTITAIDDHAPDETISAEFAVSAFRHIGSKALVILNDNDVPEISLTLSPETINESAGPMAVMAVLKRLNNINSNVKIKLSDDSNGRLYYSSPLLSLDAGVKEATFTIGVIDNALVEEDKDINITAAVHLSSCSCSATETSGGIVHAKLKLLDDDGPALKISSSQTVLQEGKEQASLLTISRNTSTEHTLSVNLSSDHDAELIYKQAVTIPAGQSSVEVPVSVKSNEVSEGDRTVTFTAQTDGYAKGICWVMVTDQTLPDAVISQFGLSASEVETGGEIGVTINIANAGVAPLSSSLIVEFFLDNESRKLGSLYTQKQLAVGENETFSKKLTLPELTGEHTIYAIVNRDQLIKELFPLNNSSERKTVKMLPKYTVSAITNKQVYNQGETVLISGIAVGNQIANVPIEIYLINANIRQELSAVTDGQGKYQVNFRPYALQDGHFVVGACYPGEKLVAEQSAFDIYGLKQIASDYNKCEIAVGEAYDGEIRLLNPGILPLNTISVEVLSVPEGCTVSFSEIKVIPGDEKATLKYHIVGTTPTNGSSWEKIKARVATAEGVSLDLDIYYYCRSLVGQLKADILSIKTTMIKDASRDYSFIIKNEGKGETGKITLSLPQGEWMKAITPLEMSSLKSGESATVILRLTPTTDMALNVPVTGTIGLNCRNGNGFSLSYNCTPVSEATGKLVIDVCNEYTYYTPEAPHLAGAKVAIMNFITDAVIMQGVTDEHGLYTIESLPEGYYKLMVSADKHDVYTNNILIDPGKENRKTVNLSFQAISIQWEVEETTVEDEYNIVTTVKYETNVPVPVVEVIMPDSLPVQELVVRGAYLFNAVLTNKGLITAQDVHIDIPEVDGLSFELLVEQDFKLRPSESVVVPVRVTVKDKDIPTIRGAVRSKNSTDGWPCHIKTYTIAFWDCGNDRKWHQYEKPIRLITCKVPSSPSSSGGGGGGGGWWGGAGTPGGSFGSGGGYTSPTNQVTPSVADKGCEPCQNGMIIAGARCVSHFVPVVKAVESIKESFDLIVDFAPEDGEPPLDEFAYGALEEVVKKAMENFDWGKLIVMAQEKVSACLEGLSDADESIPGKVLNCASQMETFLEESLEEEFDKILPEGYKAKAPKFLKSIKKVTKFLTKMMPVLDCVDDFIHACDHLEQRSMKSAPAKPTYIEAFQSKITVAGQVYEAFNHVQSEIFGNEKVWNDITMEEYDQLFVHLDGTTGADNLLIYKPTCVSEEQFRTFVERWNNTLSGNTASVNVISLQKIIEANEVVRNATVKAREWGYASMADCVEQEVLQVMDKMESGSGSVCSTISLQFSQTMTMTRQAFRGTLTVFNGHQETAMQNVKLNLKVKNASGQLVTSHEFQINNEKLDKFEGELEGAWTLAAQETGKATIVFIPTKYAAPTENEEYSFGGTLSYLDPFTGLEVTRDLFPVTLTVKPSPNLKLSYFMQRDVFGDDPLTIDRVEPMVPSEFSLLIHNVGNGEGTNINMVTAQPQIVDNEKGLMIDFQLVSQQLNGGDQGQIALGESAKTNLGNIPAGGTTYAQWWFTSTLLGHFTDYNIKATHVASYGNADLSLLDTVSIHELIRSIKISLDNQSLQTGFLTNDIADAEDLPDLLYLSDGTVENVSVATNIQCKKENGTQYVLSVQSSDIGWKYGVISDPTNGRQNLIRVIRLSDNVEIDLRNFWQTDRTLRDGKDPLYENRIHFADKMMSHNEQYQLTFTQKPEIVLSVESITGVPAEGTYISESLSEVKVHFNKPIDASTFTTEDITLTCQGQQVENMSAVVVKKESEQDFILNLSAVTSKDGYYVLTIQTSEIVDTENYKGESGKAAGWIQYIDGKVQLTIKVIPEYAGTVSPMSGRYDYNSALDLTATSEKGYQFINWSKGNVEFATEPICHLNLLEEIILVANFKAKLYNVSLTYNQIEGTIDGSGSGIYDYNTTLSLTASPHAGYTFDGWKVDDKVISTEATLAWTVKANVEIEAIFTKIPDDVTVPYELPVGWTWFAVNVKDPNLNNPLALLEPIKQSVISILGQNDDLVYDEQYGLYGSLTAFSPDRSYKVKVKGDANLELKGKPFTTNEVTVTLSRGWNWIGYIPDMEMPVSEALSNLVAVEKDIIKGQDSFAMYDGTAWKGSLMMLVPGNGYLFYSHSVNSFTYAEGGRTPFYQSRFAEQKVKVWSYDKRKYADNMNLISKIYCVDKQVVNAGKFIIGAFVGDECRGVSTEVEGYQFITVHGEQSGEKITFRAFNAVTGDEYDIKEGVNFGNNVIGDFDKPFILHLGTVTGIEKNVGGLVIYPTPVKDRLFVQTDLQDVKAVRIIDMKGSTMLVVNALPSGEGLDVSSLSEGIYFIVIETETNVVRQKFVKSNRVK